MPGRTPADAVAAFLEPFREGIKLLDGHARITATGRHGYRKGARYSWSLNGEGGMHLRQTGTFYASMTFEVVDSVPDEHDDEHQGPFRCSTRSYSYKLSTPRGADLWRMHWHPDGRSPAKGPHLHLPPDLDRHLPTGRSTFEQALCWLIEFDAPARCNSADAQARLAELEAAHLLHRTWNISPGEPRG